MPEVFQSSSASLCSRASANVDCVNYRLRSTFFEQLLVNCNSEKENVSVMCRVRGNGAAGLEFNLCLLDARAD